MIVSGEPEGLSREVARRGGGRERRKGGEQGGGASLLSISWEKLQRKCTDRKRAESRGMLVFSNKL